MLRYLITGGGDDVIARAIANGVDRVLLRDKTLPARALLEWRQRVRALPGADRVQILVHSRVDVALACGADGVHLSSQAPPPSRFRSLTPPGFLFGVSCHTAAEVRRAEEEDADFVVFGPVFETPGKGPPVGLAALQEAAHSVRIPVLALGGVNSSNADLCLAHGAAGIAGIRMFL